MTSFRPPIFFIVVLSWQCNVRLYLTRNRRFVRSEHALETNLRSEVLFRCSAAVWTREAMSGN